MQPWAQIALQTTAAYQQLVNALNNCAARQRQQLLHILSSNANTHFGRKYAFDSLHSIDQFRNKVPLHHYDQLAAKIQQQLQGQHSLLAEPVHHAEYTSGSSGAAKIIPYSKHSLQLFQAAIHPWLHDLARHYPQLADSYFAISPAGRPATINAQGISIGASSDALYFGHLLSAPLSIISVLPEQIAQLSDIRQWQYITLLYLLHTDKLTLLSVWSPTFINTLLAQLPHFAEQLIADIHNGTQTQLVPDTRLPAAPQRARIVAKALSGHYPDTALLWPDLQLISCWTHAGAARFIPRLQQLFAHTQIQGKGLLCTEGVVSIPLSNYRYPVLAVNSGFYEFLDDDENSYLAHELKAGAEYEVIMTVPGLYRYRTGDRIKAHQPAASAPQLEFIGRGTLVSDLVGEKLSDAFVTRCLQHIDGFAMLAPSLAPMPHYCLFIEQHIGIEAEQVEQALAQNPHYAYARQLGQLSPLVLIAVTRPLLRYQQWALQQGLRPGDIKPPSLSTETDWESRMDKHTI